MNRLQIVFLAAVCVGLSAPALADDVSKPPQKTQAQMMKICMDKQKSAHTQMSKADMKKACLDDIKMQKYSSGPESGTIDRPKQ